MALLDPHHPWVFTFGILGNLVSVLVYFAPLPTFLRIYREKSTMGFLSLPYVVALFSAMLWMYYALLKNALLLITINSFGCIIQTIYILLYIFYASKEARKQTIKRVAMLNVGAFCAIFLFTSFGLKGEALRIAVVGWICVFFSVCVFAAPLSIVFQVVRTRSAEFMPFTLSFALTLSAIMWFSYGLLERDICVAVPNVVGFFLGLVQMLLYGIYRNPKPIQVDVVMEKKIPEHVINIVMLGSNSEVHPLDSPTTTRSSCNNDGEEENKNDPDDEEEETADHHRVVPRENNLVRGGYDERPCSVPAQVNMVKKQLDSAVLVACLA